MVGSKDGKEAKEEKHEANVSFKHENNLSEEIQYLYRGGETAFEMLSYFFAFRSTNLCLFLNSNVFK